MPIDLNTLRRQIRTKRNALSTDVQHKASQSIANKIINSDTFQKSKKIAAYIAVQGEIDPKAIIEKIWALGKHCYLPVISKDDKQLLSFIPYEQHDTLTINQFNILEPVRTDGAICADEIDLVLVPLVAFDQHNHRLGRGAGYYDKTFAFVKEKKLSKPILLGLAYDFQQVPQLDVKPWDVPLNKVITNEE